MIEWVAELTAAPDEEFGAKPKVMTLATVNEHGAPRARTVVCRAIIEDDPSLVVASDARSEKNRQVRQNGLTELCFWLPTLRRQYRLECRAMTLSAEVIERLVADVNDRGADEAAKLAPLRENVWTELSDASRALFFWPQPGAAREIKSSRFPQAVRTGLPPDNFELIRFAPRRVEVLDLRPHPHRRRRWEVDGHNTWTGADINP